MLKNILTAGVILAGASAHAQNLSFDTNVSVEMVSATFKPAESYNISSQTQFGFGNMAYQADISFTSITDVPLFADPSSPRVSLNLFKLGFHGSYSLSNSMRAGLFATYQSDLSANAIPAYSLGGEAMFSVGNTDIEAAAAFEFRPNNFSQTQGGNLFLAAYHTITPQLELSFVSSAYVNEIGPVSRIIMASANIKYTLQNVPLSLKAGVQNAYFTWRAPLTSFRFGVSYDFGTPSELRAFGQRGLDYAELTVAARS